MTKDVICTAYVLYFGHAEANTVKQMANLLFAMHGNHSSLRVYKLWMGLHKCQNVQYSAGEKGTFVVECGPMHDDFAVRHVHCLKHVAPVVLVR